jgi:hypothetical protein
LVPPTPPHPFLHIAAVATSFIITKTTNDDNDDNHNNNKLLDFRTKKL